MKKDYLAEKIKKLRNECSSIFYKIEWDNEASSYMDNYQGLDEYELDWLKDNFFNLSKVLFISTKTFFEKKKLPLILQDFISNITPFLLDRKSSLDGGMDNDSGEVYNKMLYEYYVFLSPFEEFEIDDTYFEMSNLQLLENILENTSVIIKDKGAKPLKETEVTGHVQPIFKYAFADHSFPTTSFIKKATHYIPDILVESLGVAIEFKYAKTEKSLNKTIDEILIDVQGYANHPHYKIFYAVFYVKPGTVSQVRFKELWNEKKFPKNWKGIMVEGD